VDWIGDYMDEHDVKFKQGVVAKKLENVDTYFYLHLFSLLVYIVAFSPMVASNPLPACVHPFPTNGLIQSKKVLSYKALLNTPTPYR
jgi:hypothetical protein